MFLSLNRVVAGLVCWYFFCNRERFITMAGIWTSFWVRTSINGFKNRDSCVKLNNCWVNPNSIRLFSLIIASTASDILIMIERDFGGVFVPG